MIGGVTQDIAVNKAPTAVRAANAVGAYVRE